MGKPGNRVFRFALTTMAWVVCLPGLGAPQSPAASPPSPATLTLESKPWYTLGRVTTWAGSPVVGAEVAIYIEPRTKEEAKLQTDMHGEFEISMQSGPGPARHVKVVARKKGFQEATEIADSDSVANSEMMDLVLRAKKADGDDDPDLLSLRDLTYGVAAEFQKPGELPPAAAGRKETIEAIRTLLESDDPDGALKTLAKGLDREPQSVEFNTFRALAMLHEGSWSGATRQLTRTLALNASLDRKSRRAAPYLVLGIMQSWRGDPRGALEYFRKAAEAGASSPLLFQEMGRAELLDQNFAAAEADLGRAIQLGAPREAHMLRAGACLGQGKVSAAKTELGAYLGERKVKDLPMNSRISWVKLNDRLTLILGAQSSPAQPMVRQTTEELLAAVPELQGLEPAKDQQELPAILQKAGERVESFFNDFRNTTSREGIREERFGSNGKVNLSLTQNYQYWLLISPEFGPTSLKEYRTEPNGNHQVREATQTGLMLTEGFASISHLLLPAYQKESDFVFLGRQQREGHGTYVLAFAQRPEVSRLLCAYTNKEDNTSALVLFQGVVWIDSETYQIVRLRSDLLFPIPKQHLERQTTDIQYGQVHFSDLSYSVWLPQEVVVTLESRGKLRRNRHSYSDYRMFNVQSKITLVDDASK